MYVAVAKEEDPPAVCDSSKSEMLPYISCESSPASISTGSLVSFLIGVFWSLLLQVSQILDPIELSHTSVSYEISNLSLSSPGMSWNVERIATSEL